MEAILFPASNLKMFCSSCGQNCPLKAKHCHKCGDLLKQNVTEGARSVDEGSKKDESGSKFNQVPLEVALERQGCHSSPAFEPEKKRRDQSTLGINLERNRSLIVKVT